MRTITTKVSVPVSFWPESVQVVANILPFMGLRPFGYCLTRHPDSRSQGVRVSNFWLVIFGWRDHRPHRWRQARRIDPFRGLPIRSGDSELSMAAV